MRITICRIPHQSVNSRPRRQERDLQKGVTDAPRAARESGSRLGCRPEPSVRWHSLILVVQIEIMIEENRVSDAEITNRILAPNLDEPSPGGGDLIQCDECGQNCQ